MKNPFRYFNSSPEVIPLTVMMYIRYPLSLRQVEDRQCQSKFVYFAKTSEPDFAVIDFPAFF